MKHRNLELLTGLFVLVGLVAVAYLTVMLGAGSAVSGQTYPVEARFANAGGIHPGCSVLLSGVTVGRVEAVRFDPKDYGAVVTMKLTALLRLPADTMASVKTTGLIGDKYVALAPGADAEFLKPGDRITLTESAVDMESLIGKMAFGSVDKQKENGENREKASP